MKNRSKRTKPRCYAVAGAQGPSVKDLVLRVRVLGGDRTFRRKGIGGP
jgi:hypothetical protein